MLSFPAPPGLAALTPRRAGAALIALVCVLALLVPSSRAAEPRAAWRIPVEGRLDATLAEQTQRRIRRALAAGADLLVLEFRCAGGRLDSASELAAYVAGLTGVEVIAYVTDEARDLALLPALACERIVMQKGDHRVAAEGEEEDVPAGEARLGGFGDFLDRHPDLEALRRRGGAAAKDDLVRRREQLQDDLRDKLLPLAALHGRRAAAVVRGTCSREVGVVAVEPAAGGGERLFLTADAFEDDQKHHKRYREVLKVKPWRGEARYENRYLTLSAAQAQEAGIADAVVKDFDGLCRWRGLAASEVRAPQADWLDRLADFLEHPLIAALLILAGLTGLIVELRTRGVGVAGLTAAVCFVLFFWSHARTTGHVDWRAMLLFAAGVGLVALEAFVRREQRVACAALAGVVLLASLGLTAHGHWPRSDWLTFAWRSVPVALGLLGSPLAAYVVLRYGPRVPNLLGGGGGAAAGEDVASQPEVFIQPEKRALLGAIGVAATPLVPAGKSQFGGSFVDVVSETGDVPPGTRVQVVEVEGDRVVVKRV